MCRLYNEIQKVRCTESQMLGVLLIMDNMSFPQLRMFSLLSLSSLEVLYLV